MSLRKIVSTLPPPPTRLTEQPFDADDHSLINRGGGGRDPRMNRHSRA